MEIPMEKRKRPEILAPAGSMESLKAAIAAGCDAVYMGGNRFGARAYAENPQKDEMLAAIRYCHLHGVKIYMTVNTLLKEKELQEELFSFLLPYYQEGVDAVIVQDMGVLRFLHRHFPDLELHASTQMTLTMGKSVRLLEEYGVSRIVPARELSLSELAQMRQDTSVELEVFVHGALCYCYSGQCLFSSMLGGRSGNRGRCAQPCRMAYRLLENGQRGEYLLSPRENCNLAYVGKLIEAGVDSFKIEGRMKRPEYTALTTAMYRKYTDLYLAMGKQGYEEYLKTHQAEWQEDLRRLGELYNRNGFTSGYLEGKAGVPYAGYQGQGQMLSDLRPKHGGICVGEVTAVNRNTVTYTAKRLLHAQDVVEFRDSSQRQIYEYTLGEDKKAGEQVTTRYQKGCKILPGDAVYRTKDADLLQYIREKYLQREPKVTVRAVFTAKEQDTMKLEIICCRDNGKTVQIRTEGGVCQPAQKQPATKEAIRKLLCQTGDTPFVITDCQMQLEGNLFLPVGAVKKLRRQALQELLQQLEQTGCRKTGKWQEAVEQHSGEGEGSNPLAQDSRMGKAPHSLEQDSGTWKTSNPVDQESKIASVMTLQQFQAAVALEQVDTIYLKMDQMADGQLRQAVLEAKMAGKKVYLVLPFVFRQAVYEREKKKLSSPDNLYQWELPDGFVIRNMESFVFLRDEAGIAPSRIITDSNLYITNREAADFWRELGCGGMTLPLELTGREWEDLSGEPGLQAIVYGHVVLMVSAQCVRYNTRGCGKQEGKDNSILTLQDGKKRKFLVCNLCKYCYNVIYQERPYVLAGEKDTLRQLGICRFRYDFTVETPEQVKEILMGRLPQGHTGHFYAGVE